MARCYARRLGVRPHDIDDIMQEAFVLLLKRSRDRLASRTAFRTIAVRWSVIGAIRNLFGRTGSARRCGLDTTVRLLPEPVARGPGPAAVVENGDLAAHATAGLPAHCRAYGKMRAAGYRYDEIADAHGVTKQAVWDAFRVARANVAAREAWSANAPPYPRR